MSEEERVISEEKFLMLYHGQESRRFELTLLGGETVRGYIAEADITPGDPPRKNRIFVCKRQPYLGNARTDPEVRELRFNTICGVRILYAP